jgi:hypothetical protein
VTRFNGRIARLAGAAAVAVAVAVLPALPASAVTGSLCETFGSWCVGTPTGGTIGPGETAVNVSSPGRTIVFVPGPGGTGTLHSSVETGLCLAPASSSDLVIEWRDCSVTGVAWTWVTAGTTHYFVSQHYAGLRLSGDSVKGDPLVACPAGGCNGSWTLQQWTGP